MRFLNFWAYFQRKPILEKTKKRNKDMKIRLRRRPLHRGVQKLHGMAKENYMIFQGGFNWILRVSYSGGQEGH